MKIIESINIKNDIKKVFIGPLFYLSFLALTGCNTGSRSLLGENTGFDLSSAPSVSEIASSSAAGAIEFKPEGMFPDYTVLYGNHQIMTWIRECYRVCLDSLNKSGCYNTEVSQYCTGKQHSLFKPCYENLKEQYRQNYTEGLMSRVIYELTKKLEFDCYNTCHDFSCNETVTTTVMPTVYTTLAGVSVVSVAAYLVYKLVKQRNNKPMMEVSFPERKL